MSFDTTSIVVVSRDVDIDTSIEKDTEGNTSRYVAVSVLGGSLEGSWCSLKGVAGFLGVDMRQTIDYQNHEFCRFLS